MVPHVMEKHINAVTIVDNLEDRFEQKDLISAMECLVPGNINFKQDSN